MQHLLTALVEHQVLHHLEILRDGSLMSVDAVLQLHDGTYRLTTFVNHGERFRDSTYRQGIDRTSHLGRQFSHLETRGTTLLGDVRHQAMVVTRILVIRDNRGTSLEGEFLSHDVRTDRVQTGQCLVHSLVAHDRLAQDMAYLDLLTTLVDKLYDMEAELRLHNL